MELLDLNIKDIDNNWTINDAIRELVANAIDEHIIANISNSVKITYNNQTKTLIISDEGRGIKSVHFTENINKEKINNPNVFGKLGINLKNAIAVLVNNHINVIIKSDFGIYTPIISAKQGIIEQLPTIHIQRENNFNEQKGTIIYLCPITQQQAEQANNLLVLHQQGKWTSKSFNENVNNNDQQITNLTNKIDSLTKTNNENNLTINNLTTQLKNTEDKLAIATKDANDTHTSLNKTTSQLATIIQN